MTPWASPMNMSPEPHLPAGWDFAAAAWPERSVLRGHGPAGSGTPMVVSLAGYLVDLAWSHGIPPVELLRWIADAGSRPGVPGRSRADFEARNRDLLRKPRASLLGPTTTSAILVEALERMTLRADVRTTTLDGWAPVLPLRGAFDALRQYCPCCIEEWARPSRSGPRPLGQGPDLHEPLLWQFRAVTVCVRHDVRLRSACLNPACSSERGALAAWARPGSCGHCGSFLGARLATVVGAEGPVDQETLDWQRFVTAALSDLLVSPPGPGEVISPRATPAAVDIAVRRHSRGSYTAFAAAIRMSLGSVSLWKDGRRRPGLDAALRICAVAGFRLPDFLAGRHDALAAMPLPTRRPYVPPSDETHQVHDHDDVGRQLERAIVSDPPASLASVVGGLHMDMRQVCRLYPAECRRIRERHLEWVQARARETERTSRDLIISVMASLHARGRYPSRHQIDMLLPTKIRVRNPRIRAIWKAELVRLGYPRPDKPKRNATVETTPGSGLGAPSSACDAHGGSASAPAARPSPSAVAASACESL